MTPEPMKYQHIRHLIHTCAHGPWQRSVCRTLTRELTWSPLDDPTTNRSSSCRNPSMHALMDRIVNILQDTGWYLYMRPGDGGGLGANSGVRYYLMRGDTGGIHDGNTQDGNTHDEDGNTGDNYK